MKQLLFEDDPQFWFETLRVFGHASYGGADFGEVVATASRIKPGDYDSWHDEWLATAERLAAEAASARPVSARDAYLRASTYFRSAEFFLHGNASDPRIAYAYDRSVACFHRAVEGFEGIEHVEIPYEDHVLRGYFYRAPGAGRKPIVVMCNGFDGAAEELMFFGGLAGQERGYHVLAVDGPGQPSAIHRDGLVFRPDWEHVVAPVLDFALADPGVDSEKVALLGLSLGGLLAPRAAAFEPRIKAVVAVDGVFDAGSAVTAMLPWPREEIVRRANAAEDAEFDQLLAAGRAASPTLRWAADHGRYVMGAKTDREFLAKYLTYTLDGGVAERISCPALICEATDDLFFNGTDGQESEPRRLYARLTGPKTLLSFTAEEGADAHCHVGAQRLAAARVFDWLDETL
ncbi:alpha/beta fold hydrolase [Amycolatopsis rhabdoformis]|uniref:Alpha/beta fold hydrolase n=1 Tax=Amycolatopsis rhabdoformis TaxID=1448059 RepID=A0ABZ1HZ25_9PSEU|nr:alpha/beta fold hydrolase [Amycolatopsis rhabdoformis]WSE26756.1 alpha/beta fold hydrolase [Amycolatopsis rhabdoformis]